MPFAVLPSGDRDHARSWSSLGMLAVIVRRGSQLLTTVDEWSLSADTVGRKRHRAFLTRCSWIVVARAGRPSEEPARAVAEHGLF